MTASAALARAGAGAPASRIGPNAVLRLAEALQARLGLDHERAVFARAGLERYLREPPREMVDEDEVRRLHQALREVVDPAVAREIAREAGRRTAAYLRAHRIPRAFQRLLQLLPAPLAARALVAAIRRHAWTFVGSGHFSVEPAGRPGALVLCVRDNPLCRGVRSSEPACEFFAGTFDALFRALVHPAARAVEIACEARGDAACRFEISWQPPRPAVRPAAAPPR